MLCQPAIVVRYGSSGDLMPCGAPQQHRGLELLSGRKRCEVTIPQPQYVHRHEREVAKINPAFDERISHAATIAKARAGAAVVTSFCSSVLRLSAERPIADHPARL